jgi:hypothetical protein
MEPVGCANSVVPENPACFEAGSVVEPGVGGETFDVGERDVIFARARLPVDGLMRQMD